jgi:hypothetical protein
MIQLKDFSLLFLLLLSAATYSQNKIVGTITDSNETAYCCRVFNKTSNTKVFTNIQGSFVIDLNKTGSFDFVLKKAT